MKVSRLTPLALLGIVSCAAPSPTPPKSPSAPTSGPPPAASGRVPEAPLSSLPAPLRVRYVSPSGGGNGASTQVPTTLRKAIDSSRPGDEIRVMSGTYEGKFRIWDGGTAQHPVVIRANPGETPKVFGWLQVADGVPSVWIWGLEVTYPAPFADKGDGCISIKGPDDRVINNYIHDCTYNGIGAWKANRRPSPGQIVYGNVILRSDHAIYTQNRFEEDGEKRFVNNIVLDAGQVPGRRASCCFALHAYTEQGYVSGIDVEKGIFANDVLVGGKHFPSDHIVIRDNLFYRRGPVIGYRRPVQVTFVGNYVARAPAWFLHWWGAEEGQYRVGPSVVTDNEFYNPVTGRGEFRNLQIRTEAYVPDPADPKKMPKRDTSPHLRPDDVFDRNRYSDPPNSFNWWIGGEVQSGGRFADWRAAAGRAGNAAFDANSSLVPAPTAAKVVAHANEYDPARVHVGVVNWGSTGPAQVSVELGNAFPPQTRYSVYRARDLSGAPVASGTYAGTPISIPVDGEFDAFVVVAGELRAGS